jgi:hypothetical protein
MFDHSETILGPFKKLPFLGQDPLILTNTNTHKHKTIIRMKGVMGLNHNVAEETYVNFHRSPPAVPVPV